MKDVFENKYFLLSKYKMNVYICNHYYMKIHSLFGSFCSNMLGHGQT